MRYVILAALLVACQPGETRYIDVSQNVVAPNSSTDMQAAFASALACDPSGMVWSIQEAAGVWNPAMDGSVSASGVLSAPKCGSPWVGATIHVQALCVANGRTGVAAITTAEENLNTVQIAQAIVRECGSAPCRAANPGSVNVRLCLPSEPQTTIQFYSSLTFTCSTVYSPDLPADFTSLPVCP